LRRFVTVQLALNGPNNEALKGEAFFSFKVESPLQAM
jgi:hypothetical protein